MLFVSGISPWGSDRLANKVVGLYRLLPNQLLIPETHFTPHCIYFPYQADCHGTDDGSVGPMFFLSSDSCKPLEYRRVVIRCG